MGRIKTRFAKTSGEKIFQKGIEDFTENFEDNKKVVDKYAVIPSKKLKNVIVGYITRLARRLKTE